jgi:hypothetical protein
MAAPGCATESAIAVPRLSPVTLRLLIVVTLVRAAPFWDWAPALEGGIELLGHWSPIGREMMCGLGRVKAEPVGDVE